MNEKLSGTKFYIVREDELERLKVAAYYAGFNNLDHKRTEKAEAACRARLVPDWATHFAENVEGPLDFGLYSLNLYDLIKYEE